jgi:hypothetical protein
MKNILCFLIVISVLLMSCAVKGRITKIYFSDFSYGKVIEKNYIPEYSTFESRVNANGKGSYLQTVRHPEVYKLVLLTVDDFNGLNHTKEISVSRDTFYNNEIGGFFGSMEDVNRYTVEIKDVKGNFGWQIFPYTKVKMLKVGDFVDFNVLNN